MKERPILFNAPMVRAILEGRKTQTRRVVKPNILPAVEAYCDPSGYKPDIDPFLACPFGKIGDRLWVRETAVISPPNFNDGSDCNIKDDQGRSRIVQWVASYPNTEGAEWYGLKKTPSIHMPRWASRITLEITDVRVQRLQNISNEDAVSEGCAGKNWHAGQQGDVVYPCHQFKELWNSINGKPRKDGVDISWQANPWVWVVSFQPLEKSSIINHQSAMPKGGAK